MRWETHTAKVLGLRINYAKAGGGPPLVLVHGAVASHVAWWENIIPLSQHFTVYAPDLPSHGDSEAVKHGKALMFGAPRFIGEFMDAVGVRRAVLVGNSGGGTLIALFAMRSPDRTSHLVLVDSGGFGREVSWFLRIASLPLVGELLHLRTINSDSSLQASIFHKPRPMDPELAKELRRVRNLWDTRMAVAKAIRGGISIFGARKEMLLTDQLKTLNVPLLIVWGEKDPILPISQALRAANQLPEARVHIMRDCGHWPHMENPEEFNRTVLGFLGIGEREKGD
jgi:4,5:9,10-diseco-3-hydroxy-5,9,17-trioxoandrosta-1(10),2-diene-4-oate hydrolase